jgi:ferredoxin
MSKYKVEVDRQKCHGFGACVELCSDSFYFGEDGKSKIRGAEEVVEGGANVKDVIEVEDIGCYKQAEASCPFQAIKVE